MARWAYALIIGAATLWGIISVFVIGLAAYGFTTLQVVAIRVVVSAVMLTLYVAFRDRDLLKIHVADGKYFIGTGICSLAFFNWCYFTAIRETSVAVAAILLYTAPAFVLVLSWLLFREEITQRKFGALAMTFCGCALVVGVVPSFQGTISLYGLITGLGAGFGYALYSIFGKLALQKYNALTVTTYTFIFAAAVMVPISGLWEVSASLLYWPVVIYSMGFSLFSTVLAYLCYTVALSYIETGRAAIAATLEPIVATIVGTVFFGQQLTYWQILGIVCIITAVASIQRGNDKPAVTEDSQA